MKLQPASPKSSSAAKETKLKRVAKSRKPREPLYKQVVQTLKNEILAGMYPVDAQLPTENELSVRFEVSRHTVREALRQLRDDGLVSSRQGAGTTVVRPGAGQTYIQEVSSINDLISFAASTRYEIDAIEMIESDAELISRIGGSEGDQWMRIRGFRYSPEHASPFCWTEIFINSKYAGIARLLRRQRGPIFELIEDMYGERVGEVDQVFVTTIVPDSIAPTLNVEKDTFVIQIQRAYRLVSGEVAQIAFHFVPPQRFTFSMQLRRVKI